MTSPRITFLPDPRPDLLALEDQITELTAHIQAATYRLLELIREFDEKNGWEGPGLRSCAHWLNWKCGIAIGAAREKVRVAHALKDLPQIRQAFKSGRTSYSKVRAMTRVATPENEGLLLDIAFNGTAAHVERVVSGYRKTQRIEAARDENRRHLSRKLSWYVDDDGSWVFRGRFTAEQGALIIKAIEAGLDELFEDGKNQPEEDEAEPEYPAGARRADAFERIAESYLADPGRSLNGGERYMIQVHTDLDTLREDGECAHCDIEERGHVSAETSRRMACDASLVHILEQDGEPLSVGRKTRTIPPAIRRALQRRDGGCRFPGCTCTRFVDAHHIIHWADGGETRMDNLVLLCRHHHRLVHEGGYGVQKGSGGEIYFTNPSGQTIPRCPRTRFRGDSSTLVEENTLAGLEITPNTPVPGWLGEKMDVNVVLAAMIQVDCSGLGP